MLRTDVPFSHIHTPQYVATRNSGRSGKSGAAGHFYDTLLELDETVGSIMAALAENKLDENTLVLVTGDNGPCECSNGRRGLSLLLRSDGRPWLRTGEIKCNLSGSPGPYTGLWQKQHGGGGSSAKTT